MICCLNPDCQNPQNPDTHKFCQSCRTPLIPLLRNRYRPIQLLSDEGGFGRTYLAEDNDKLNERCVIKQLAPQVQGTQALNKAVELFQQEAKRLQELGDNPQIPTLYAYFQEGNYLYLVQQFIDGENLLKDLQQRGTWNESQIRELLENLLPVLQFIHQRQVIHRDIKPQNIMRRRDGRLVLIDFGASKQLTATIVAKTGTRIGSLGYSPLEQLQDGEAYPASDLFSLGATCFHLLSGVPPWDLWKMQGYGWVSSWRQHLKNPVSQELGGILDKLLQVDMQQRYQSVGEVLADLNSQKVQVKTLIVCKLGRGDCRSISEAIRKAKIGTRILVQPGTYSESLVIDKPLEIIGDGSVADIVIESTDSECIRMQTDYAVVRGFTLRNQTGLKADNHSAVDISQGQLILENCDISSDLYVCVAIHNSTAKPIIRRCKIHDGKKAGVFVWDNGQGTVEDCDIFGNTLAGVAIKTGGNPVIRRCKIHDGKQTGVIVWDNGQGTVEDCDIFGNTLAGVAIKTGGNPVIRRCKIHDGKQTGVIVWDNGQGTVEDCDIFGNTLAGVAIKTGGNPVIRRCKINRNSNYAVYVHDNGKGTVENCDLTANIPGTWNIGWFSKVQRSGNKE